MVALVDSDADSVALAVAEATTDALTLALGDVLAVVVKGEKEAEGEMLPVMDAVGLTDVELDGGVPGETDALLVPEGLADNVNGEAEELVVGEGAVEGVSVADEDALVLEVGAMLGVTVKGEQETESEALAVIEAVGLTDVVFDGGVPGDTLALVVPVGLAETVKGETEALAELDNVADNDSEANSEADAAIDALADVLNVADVESEPDVLREGDATDDTVTEAVVPVLALTEVDALRLELPLSDALAEGERDGDAVGTEPGDTEGLTDVAALDDNVKGVADKLEEGKEDSLSEGEATADADEVAAADADVDSDVLDEPDAVAVYGEADVDGVRLPERDVVCDVDNDTEGIVPFETVALGDTVELKNTDPLTESDGNTVDDGEVEADVDTATEAL